MKMTARLLLAPALVAAVALSGCGSATTPPTAGASSSGAMSTKPETPQQFLARLEAAASKKSTVSMKITGGDMRGSGSARLGSDPAATYVFDIGDANTVLVLVDGVVYTKDGADSAARWTATPATDIGMAEGFTPKGTFSEMRQGAKSVTNKGPEDLQGTPTTKYELTVDTVAAGAAAVVTPSPGTPDSVFSIWVDQDDLLRRVSVPAEGSTLVVDYSGWGEPVEVVAPPADQVD